MDIISIFAIDIYCLLTLIYAADDFSDFVLLFFVCIIIGGEFPLTTEESTITSSIFSSLTIKFSLSL